MEIEERKKIIKTLIFFATICVLIIIGTLIYNNFIKDDGAKSSNKYLILGNYLILQKTNTGFKQIDKLNDEILDYKYTITNQEQYKNDITMQFLNNEWYFFDKDYNEVTMQNFKAATHNLLVNLADFVSETITNPLDDEYIEQFIYENQISNKTTYRASRIAYDFDKDGNPEYIYTISNYSLSVTDYSQKGFIFIVKDNKIININNNDGNGPFTVMQILDLDNDDNYELIVNKGDIDVKSFDSCYQIYKMNEGKWQLEKDCKQN